jgi:hypothetical protein
MLGLHVQGRDTRIFSPAARVTAGIAIQLHDTLVALGDGTYLDYPKEIGGETG